MIVSGYKRLSRRPVTQATGFAIVLFVTFIFTFDREFEERRKIEAVPDFHAVFASADVARYLSALINLLLLMLHGKRFWAKSGGSN
jgi:hypothetical protein